MLRCYSCQGLIAPGAVQGYAGRVFHEHCLNRYKEPTMAAPLIGTPASHSLALLADNPETFYILWCPESEKPSRMVFTSDVAAWRVADEMARKNPSSKFFVMESKGYSRTDEPVVRHMTLAPGTIQAEAEAKLKGKAPIRRKK